ncbi:hypothetical protein FRC00_014144 [Tulasnella sp. 408]|nr:hypothetical protein FRC00_014144 [Tulasnella sp. 408]
MATLDSQPSAVPRIAPYSIGGAYHCAIRGDGDEIGDVEVVEDDDDDAWDGLLVDGVGEEMVEADSGQAAEDLGNATRTGGDSGNAAVLGDAQLPEEGPEIAAELKHLPRWVAVGFKAVLQSPFIKEKSATRMPKLYSELKTFWHPSPSPIFQLRDAEDFKPADVYEPRFFYWDPQPLVQTNSILCPNKDCNSKLVRNGNIAAPRRVVGLDELYWVIGVRYRCPTCVNPKTRKTGKLSFNSWDPRILASLPPSLAAAFPAHLTARSGIDKTAFRLLRAACGNGVGTKQFADMLSNLHQRRHDERHLLYLETILAGPGGRGIGMWPNGTAFEPFRPYADREGYAGFTPSSQWLREVYDTFIESHLNEFNQYTAMLPLDVGALDHSHKITKHIALIDGVPTWTALMSITNQYGDIRGAYLTTSKAQSQFTPALCTIAKSLPLYGHRLPQLFYTDNVDDAPMLKRCFPSLAEGVTPVDENAALPPFSIPDDVSVKILHTLSQIDDAMNSIMDCLELESDDENLVIGLDTEWNVDRQSPTPANTAVMQIAFQKKIYVIQVAQYTAVKQLPQSICSVLKSDRILKVGRMIHYDLKRLSSEAKSGFNYRGAVELARLAKQRGVMPTARTSLSALVARTIGRYLEKDQSIRVSSNWDRQILSDEQVRYAAMDAYAGLAVYEHLIKIPAPGNIPAHPAYGLAISLWHDDGSRIIAHGVIGNQVNILNNINVTPTRIVVTIQQVIVPSTVVLVRQHQELTPTSVPFDLVVLRRKVQTRHTPILTELSNSPSPIAPASTINEAMDVAPGQDSAPFVASDLNLSTEDEDLQDSETVAALLVAMEAFDGSINDDGADAVAAAILDPDSKARAAEMLEEIERQPWKTEIRSRVVKDCFHVMQGIPISRAHALKRPFARALRDAILIPDAEDRHRISAVLRAADSSWERQLRINPTWLWKRCKRIIPPPEQLLPTVQKVFTTYGPLKDAKTGLPLFNSAAWNAAKNALKLIKNGYLSDPPGIPLYYVVGLDKKMDNLPMYRCIRGTNFVEGGVHQNIRRRLPLFGASPRHTVTRLIDYILKHNLVVGTYNRTGKHYIGHFDIWLLNDLQAAMFKVQEWVQGSPLLTGWVNGTLYIPTAERFGILPLPPDVQNEMGMVPFSHTSDTSQKYHYLASQQNTRYAALPVHNAGEKRLFSLLMSENAEFNSPNPNWSSCAREWNRFANGTEIYYKVCGWFMTC